MVLKLVLIGDPSVGKTSLRLKFFGIGFKSQYAMTIGAEFSIMDVKAFSEEVINSSFKAQVWDLQTQKQFKQSRPLFYNGTHIIGLVYDVSNPQSFENLPIWIKESQEHTGIVPLILIGNKIDLRSHNKNSVTTEMGIEFAKSVKKNFLDNLYNVPVIETSIVTGEVHPANVNIELLVKDEKVLIKLFDFKNRQLSI